MSKNSSKREIVHSMGEKKRLKEFIYLLKLVSLLEKVFESEL